MSGQDATRVIRRPAWVPSLVGGRRTRAGAPRRNKSLGISIHLLVSTIGCTGRPEIDRDRRRSRATRPGVAGSANPQAGPPPHRYCQPSSIRFGIRQFKQGLPSTRARPAHISVEPPATELLALSAQRRQPQLLRLEGRAGTLRQSIPGVGLRLQRGHSVNSEQLGCKLRAQQAQVESWNHLGDLTGERVVEMDFCSKMKSAKTTTYGRYPRRLPPSWNYWGVNTQEGFAWRRKRQSIHRSRGGLHRNPERPVITISL